VSVSLQALHQNARVVTATLCCEAEELLSDLE